MRMCTLLPFIALGTALPAIAGDAPLIGADTLREQAIGFLEKHLEDLREIHTRSQAFTSAFIDESARHPCDICRDRTAIVDVHKYAFEAEQAYPGRFDFTTEIDRDAITVLKFDRNEYRFRIPYVKHIPASPLASGDGNRQDLRKPFDVKLIAVVKYINGRFAIENVESEAPPPPNALMVELAPMLMIGKVDFDDQPGFAPDVKGTLIKAGFSWYFGPGGMKKKDIWLKTGLRIALRRQELESEDLRYERDDVTLTPALGHGGLVVDPAPSIDILTDVRNLNETVRSTTIEIPFGISKRLPLSSSMDLALEAEVGYSFVLAASVEGDYVLDRTGTDHTIAGETMLANGGQPLTYLHPDAAVKEAATGDVIDFFTDRVQLLDEVEPDKHGYLSFGFLPSLMIHKEGRVKYNIGLRFQLVRGPDPSDTVLDENYFLNVDDHERPTLSTLSSTTYQTFIGLTLGTTL